MNQFKRYYFILYCFLLFAAGSCTDKWDEHNEVTDPSLKENLITRIKDDAQLSKFAELIVKSGYDTVLASSRNFTVWAPTDQALAALDPNIVSNPALLRSFVGNHITYSSYLTNMPAPLLKLRALNGKNVVFTSNTIDEITITKANQYVSNGVLHIISGAILPKKNIYEFLLTEADASMQREFIQSLDTNVFDPSNAEIIGVNPNTGKPIYKEGTDSVVFNSYINSTKINSEDSLFTYVILTDAAFQTEQAKLNKYFSTTLTGKQGTEFLTKRSVVKDLTFPGLYLPGSLPDSIRSTTNLNVHLDPSAIVSTHRLSNGIVYVMNRIDYKTPNKLGTIVIQGESPRTLSVANLQNYLTTRRNPDGLTTYIQVRGDNFSTAKSWYRYTTTLNSVKYRVYWRAIRDFGLAPGPSGEPTYFQQRVAFKTFDATDLPYKEVRAKEKLPAPATGPRVYEPIYDDVYIGEYTVSKYGAEQVFIVSNTVNTVGLNSIVLDYIKLVPVTD